MFNQLAEFAFSGPAQTIGGAVTKPPHCSKIPPLPQPLIGGRWRGTVLAIPLTQAAVRPFRSYSSLRQGDIIACLNLSRPHSRGRSTAAPLSRRPRALRSALHPSPE